MVINPTPSSLPVVTVNLPTEAVVQQNTQQQRVAPVVKVSANSTTKSGSEKVKTAPAKTSPPVTSGTGSTSPSISTEPGPSEGEVSQSKQNSVSLSEGEQQVLQELKTRDREVKQHEAAHATSGGSLTGAPQLSYVKGPDGVLYARSGEVSIDIAKVPNDPEATIRKMDKVVRAALAPAEPSVQDQQIAAKASAIAAQARAELAEAKRTELEQRQQETEENRKQELQQARNTQDDESEPSDPFPGFSGERNRRIQDLPRLIRSTGATDIDDINSLIGSRFSQST